MMHRLSDIVKLTLDCNMVSTDYDHWSD